MPQSSNNLFGSDRRRTPRMNIDDAIAVTATNLLDEEQSDAGLWDLGEGGACVVLETRFRRGTRLNLEFRGSGRRRPLVVWAEVEHAEICCPSVREMWLTGCSFNQKLGAEDMRSLTTGCQV